MAKLQVLICTIGEAGIKRVLSSQHPSLPGVEYLVAWQQPDSDLPIPIELQRDDFKVYITDSRGLSRNRNFALSKSDAELCLISDDDVDYQREELQLLIELFEENSDLSLITFEYRSAPAFQKKYPAIPFDLNNPPKGYYVTSFEIAFRRSDVYGKFWFNEHFGLGVPVLASGEEDLFLHDILKSGLKCRFYPVEIGTHIGSTTSDRENNNHNFWKTKGAIFKYMFPVTWLPRLIVNALRQSRRSDKSFFYFMRNAFAGIRYARQNDVFENNNGKVLS